MQQAIAKFPSSLCRSKLATTAVLQKHPIGEAEERQWKEVERGKAIIHRKAVFHSRVSSWSMSTQGGLMGLLKGSINEGQKGVHKR